MLILTRRISEAIVVNGPAVFYVLGVQGDRVKVGIKADPGVRVWRDELLQGAIEARKVASV